MNNTQSKSPAEVAAAPGVNYNEALVREGLQPSEELVQRVRQMHLATLTPSLVLRAFSAHRHAQTKLRQQQEANKSTTAATPSRS